MPFADRGYDRETEGMLSRVFDSAWERLQLAHLQTSQPQNAETARAELEKRIAEAHAGGERDPETIALVALRAFNRWLQRDELAQTKK